MSTRSRTAIVALLIAMISWGPGLAPIAAGEAGGAAAPTWPELLVAADASPDQQTRALGAVKSLAAGNPGDPATREAIFALAEYWSRRGTEGLGVEATQALNTATALYVDDLRTPGLLRTLAIALIERDDPYGAHTAFRRLIGLGTSDDDPELLARAAANAVAAGDMAAALDWSLRVDPEAVGSDERIMLHLARTSGGHAMGRSEMAFDSVEILLAEAAGALHADEHALLAAAETLEAVGLLPRAIPLYYRFVSVHPRAYRHAHALYKLGELYARTGSPEHARAHWTWLLERYPDSVEAHRARMELLTLDDGNGRADRTDDYVTVIRTARTTDRGLDACHAFIDGHVGSGRPLAVADALLAAATPDPRRPLEGLGRTLIEHCLELALTPVLGLLEARGDTISIAAIAARSIALGVTIPAGLRPAVEDARRALGLPATPDGPLHEAIESARAAMSDGRSDEALRILNRAGHLDPDASDELRADAERLEIEILWRADRANDALETAAIALARPALDARRERALRVLIADINFSQGRLDTACGDYRRAAELADTPWVGAQLARCRATSDVAGATR